MTVIEEGVTKDYTLEGLIERLNRSSITNTGKTDIRLAVDNEVSGRQNWRSVYKDKEGKYYIIPNRRYFKNTTPARIYVETLA